MIWSEETIVGNKILCTVTCHMLICLTTGSQMKKEKDLVCSICQILWCKYSDHGHHGVWILGEMCPMHPKDGNSFFDT